MDKKRLTATKTKIKEISGGSFVKQEGFNPNYVLAKDGLRLSRVRVLATIVDKFVSDTGKFASLTLDDGTDTVRAKIFNAMSLIDGLEKGDVVDMVGRVKEYQDEVYLAPEIIWKTETAMEILRELEYKQQEKETERKKKIVLQHRSQVADAAELVRVMQERFNISEDEVEAFLQSDQQEEKEKDDLKKHVLSLIEKMDSGEGCEYKELVETSNMKEEEIDSIIADLLGEGSCFEPRPGRIKKV